jgi:hypothetical protein
MHAMTAQDVDAETIAKARQAARYATRIGG